MKNRDFAIAAVVIVVAALAIGGMLYYFMNNSGTSGITPTSSITPTGTFPTQPGLVWQGSVTSVDSAGGHFTISDAAYQQNGLELLTGQGSQLQYNQSVDVKVVYGPTNQVVFEAPGHVTSITTYNIQIIFSSTPATPLYEVTIPLSWNPRVGDQVTLSI
jgi:hypothetical protein